MARAVATGSSVGQRNRLVLAAALVLAAIASAAVFVTLQDASDGSTGDKKSAAVTVDVVVATQEISANTTITADMLELRPVSSSAVLEGTFGAIEALVGLPTRIPIQSGEQVTSSKVGLSVIEDKEDLALVLEPGRRGFAVEVSEVTGVGGLLLPGNFVDVIAVFPEGPGRVGAVGTDADPSNIKAVTILQDVELIAVGQEAQEPVPAPSDPAGPGSRGQRPDDAERQPAATSATLAVTAGQAQLLALVQETGGRIWLSLRPAGDHATVPTSDANFLPFLSPEGR